MFILLLFAGGLYIPAAMASVSLSSSIIGALVQISPHKIIPMVATAPAEYLIISLIMVCTGLLHTTTQVVCVLFSGAWIGSVISVPFSLYLLFVEMRLLGLFMRLTGKRIRNEDRWKLLEAGKLPHRRRPVATPLAGTATMSGA
jgi:hypothetical protein